MGDGETQEPIEVTAIRATEAVIVEGMYDLFLSYVALPTVCLTFLYVTSTRKEATDALSMIALDRQRLRVVFQQLAVATLSSSPLQQFGIGFGVGW